MFLIYYYYYSNKYVFYLIIAWIPESLILKHDANCFARNNRASTKK